ncbi:hypothetical protein, partial [Pseudomonas sp. ANT_H14]
EVHKALAEGVLTLTAENEALKGPHDWLAEDLIKELDDNAQSFQENACGVGEDPFVIVLLAAASRIRRQEVNIVNAKAENVRLQACEDVLTKALTDVREALGRECRDQYAGLDETRDILDAALKSAERTNTSSRTNCPYSGICHTSSETCAKALAQIEGSSDDA